MLSDQNITVEDLKVLYLELLCRVDTICDANQMESFEEAYVRCPQDFESLLQSPLEDLHSALRRLEHLIADVKRRVTLIERVHPRRETLW